MNALQKRCLAGSIFASMMFLASLYVLQGSLLNHIIDYFVLSDVAQGLPSTVASFGSVLALISSFFLIGRMTKLNILRLAISITSVFLLVLPFIKIFAVFVIVWFCIGICLGYVDMLLSSCMADIYEGRTATRMMCFLHATYGASSMAMPAVVAVLLNHGLPWKQTYLIVAVIGILILISMTLIIKKAPEAATAVSEQSVLSIGDMWKLFFTPSFPLQAAAIFFHGMFLSGCITWINRFVGVTLKSNLGDLALSFIFAGVLAGRLSFSFLPVNPVKYVKTVGFVSGILFAAASLSGSGMLVCAASLICGLLFGPIIPCLLTLSCNAVKESSMFATTVMMLGLYAGQTLIHPMIGALESAIGLKFGMLLIALCMCITSLMNVLNKNLQ